MCFSKPSIPSISTTSVTEQLNKNNATLSNEKVAGTTTEKKTNKRTVSSLRVPLDKTTNTSNVGANTTGTATGLNIPV